jgi:CBS domain-containing protein
MAQPGQPSASALMHAPEVQPAPNTPLATLIAPMIHRGAMALPVLDQGRLVGFVTRRTLLSALLRDRGRRISVPPT